MGGQYPDAILTFTSIIVAAYVSNNSVPIRDLPALIRSVHGAVRCVPSSATISLKPAVPVHKSITPDYLICLEDGAHLKLLKRHLRSRYGLTPAQYRSKWELPGNYPMIAPNYATRRSNLAKKHGLGRLHTSIAA
jgi:predicted transcriptional regulator